MSTPQPPSVDQLSAARLAHWRQSATAEADASTRALTLESARQFVSSCGLLLFTPRPQHISSPAPSFVEATSGLASTAPSLSEIAEARTLLARLIAEGSAVPLNLLGAPSATPDTPDFIASAATFPYVFTLRGDKAFKQLPSTSGATKVSPLALNTYNLLLENGPSSASDLAAVLGKEVTEAAVLRALNELWQHLRVLPIPQVDGGSTLWETVTNRFTKQLKAGANAGQPSALSALISLYLSQSLLATETDVETFLSPLAPRSRVRDVLHALSGARQLETIAVEGRTHLHVHGELPSFHASPESDTTEPAVIAPAGEIELAEDGSRIKKFVPKPRKVGTGFVERAKPFRSNTRPGGETRTFERRGPARPADRGSKGGSSNRTFNKPWDEEKQQRAARMTEPSGDAPFQDLDLDANAEPPADRRSASGTRPPKRDFGTRPGVPGDRGKFTPRPSLGGNRPAFGRQRAQDGTDRPRRRDAAETAGSSFGGDRKPYPKSEYKGRKEQSFGTRPFADDKERRPFRRAESSDAARPPRKEFRSDRGDAGRPKSEGFARSTPFRERSTGDAASSRRPERPPFRKFDAPRAPRKPFPQREGDSSAPPRRESSSRPGFATGGRSFVPRGGTTGDAKRQEGGSFGRRESGGYAAKRDSGSFAGKRPAGSKPSSFAGKKPFAGKAPGRRPVDAPGASTFDKFKGGNKPWGKRPPGRKPKPEEGES